MGCKLKLSCDCQNVSTEQERGETQKGSEGARGIEICAWCQTAFWFNEWIAVLLASRRMSWCRFSHGDTSKKSPQNFSLPGFRGILIERRYSAAPWSLGAGRQWIISVFLKFNSLSDSLFLLNQGWIWNTPLPCWCKLHRLYTGANQRDAA